MIKIIRGNVTHTEQPTLMNKEFTSTPKVSGSIGTDAIILFMLADKLC